MPFKVFTNGVPLPASDLNDYLMEQSIATFADSAARAAQLVSPTEGQVTYLADTDLIQYWSGSAWVDFGAAETQIATTSLTGASVTFSSIPQTYKHLVVQVVNFRPSTDAVLWMRMNSLSTAIYSTGSNSTASGSGDTAWQLGSASTAQDSGATNNYQSRAELYNYTNATSWRLGFQNGVINDPTTPTTMRNRMDSLSAASTAAITSLTLLPSTGTFTSGTATLFGVR